VPARILVGYDPKERDRAPVEFALAAARFTGAPVTVASVFADSAMIGQMGHGSMDEELASESGEALDHLSRSLDTAGLRVEFASLGGRSAPSILHEFAESVSADLLVIGAGSGRHGGLVRSGSTADRLIHGAPCPIAVVPTGWERGGAPRTIGAAYVDTPEGREALTGATALARRAGAKLRVIAAVKPREFGRSAGGPAGHEVTTFDAVGKAEGAARDAAMALIGDPGDLVVDVDVSAQDAADFLIAASEHIDLLVCGSRGYGPRRAVMLGGVTHRVTREAHCPVIVLTRVTESQLEALIAENAGTTA
jgi:nucleotide-binding universal stress UspA family protein